MFKVQGILLSPNYNGTWIIGFLASFVGFYTMAFLVEHRRLEIETQRNFKAHLLIMLFASIVFTITTWCHYAFSLTLFTLEIPSTVDDYGPITFEAAMFVLKNQYSIQNALISLSIVCFATISCLGLSSHDQFFSSTNDQRVEILRSLFTMHTNKATIRELRVYGKTVVRLMALFRRTKRHLVSGGIIAASQILIRLLMFRNAQPELFPLLQFQWFSLFLLWLAATCLSALGFWGLFRLLSWKRFEWLRLGSAAALWSSSVLTEWVSLKCIRFGWTDASVSSLSVTSNRFYGQTGQESIYLPVLAVIGFFCIVCLMTMLLELRENYLQLVTDFAKVISLMDAAYVSGHVTHNFERCFERFINAALPLMASHIKITEPAYENFELSRSRENSHDSITSFSRKSSSHLSRVNSKVRKLLGNTGAMMGQVVARAHSSFLTHKEKSRKNILKNCSPGNVPEPEGCKYQVQSLGTARRRSSKNAIIPNSIIKGSSQRILPLSDICTASKLIEQPSVSLISGSHLQVKLSDSSIPAEEKAFEEKASPDVSKPVGLISPVIQFKSRGSFKDASTPNLQSPCLYLQTERRGTDQSRLTTHESLLDKIARYQSLEASRPKTSRRSAVTVPFQVEIPQLRKKSSLISSVSSGLSEAELFRGSLNNPFPSSKLPLKIKSPRRRCFSNPGEGLERIPSCLSNANGLEMESLLQQNSMANSEIRNCPLARISSSLEQFNSLPSSRCGSIREQLRDPCTQRDPSEPSLFCRMLNESMDSRRSLRRCSLQRRASFGDWSKLLR